MDPYHHQWRPFPCPTCSHIHFPLCPPPSDPPPPYPQNPTNQFPYPSQPDPYPNPNPYYPRPGLHSPATPQPDPARFHKRPRVDADDERRLKLIRDHGASATWAPPAPGDINYYAYTNMNNDISLYSPFNPNGSPGFRGYFTPFPPPQPPRGYENGGYYVPPPPPPPPASPPPPPPQQPLHSPPEASFSLFPVPVSSSLGPSPLVHRVLGSGGAVSEDKPTVVDASHLFKQSYRATRPGHLVIILRGLPGSGKSYIAKMMRDLEVENGSEAPRIHSMDDYFMTEVEKVEDVDATKSSTSTRGKKPVVKKVMEYCYEPEMEEAYRESMLKAFKKTLEEGIFTLVIVDDRNLRVADFAQFWAIAKRSGYEVYISEAPYKDPAGCAARNVHGFTLAQIQKMAHEWEEAPSFYLQLCVKSLFHGDDLKESGIQEFDMDAGDEDLDDDPPGLPEEKPEKAGVSPLQDEPLNGDSENRNRWHNEEDHHGETKELGKSKWSNNVEEEDLESTTSVKGNPNALSGLIQAYGKRGKSVRWSDQAGDIGFSIGAAMRKSTLSLVIGAGAGYNLKSNPLPASESSDPQRSGRSTNQNVFQDQIRAERESTKAVFDRRRQRIASGEE